MGEYVIVFAGSASLMKILNPLGVEKTLVMIKRRINEGYKRACWCSG